MNNTQASAGTNPWPSADPVMLEEAQSAEQASPRALWCLELARLHTALAQVAATALDSDSRAWFEVAGSKLSG